MKKRALTAGTLAGALFLALAPGATAAQNITTKPSTSKTMTWEKFEKQAYKDVDGQYIVDGDIPISNIEELRDYYNKAYAPAAGPGELIGNTDTSGNITLWSQDQARDLTYCVSDKFGSRKSSVINATAGGAAMWENASSGIKFTYVPSQDSRCNTSNNEVLFSIEPASSRAGYIARAFFPNASKSNRNILVSPSLTTSGGWQPENIMGHELGHVLGFRHEHIRPEARNTNIKCIEPSNWQPITDYDSASIMHYPQCNGSSENLEFSETDREGVQKVYGS